jgi:hypothetical protein
MAEGEGNLILRVIADIDIEGTEITGGISSLYSRQPSSWGIGQATHSR